MLRVLLEEGPGWLPAASCAAKRILKAFKRRIRKWFDEALWARRANELHKLDWAEAEVPCLAPVAACLRSLHAQP